MAAFRFWRCSIPPPPEKRAGAGDVWSGDMPYLRSVDSPEGEETVPNYYSAAEFTAAEAKALLAQAHPELAFSGGPDKWFGAVEKDESGRVGTVEVCGAPLRGVEVRRIFSLRSPALPSTRRRMG